VRLRIQKYCFFFLIVISSCKEEDPCLYTEEVIDFYLEIATNLDNGQRNFPIAKWKSDLHIYISGNPRDKDLEEIVNIVDEINTLQNQISLIFIDEESKANVSVLVGDTTLLQEKWAWLGSNGQFGYSFSSVPYEIKKGFVWLNSEVIDQEFRNWLLRHELTQVLGLPNDIKQISEYTTSIFNEWAVYNTEYSDLDKLVIQMHYSDVIECGMTSEEIRNLTCWK
jgi:hypothetical protein